MSAVKTLRRAAAAIRKDQEIAENLGHIDGRTYATWLAVADWLDGEANALEDRNEAGIGRMRLSWEPVIRVARAYLGEPDASDEAR